MLGWELPPHNSGGLGVACYQMSKALAMQGASIDFVVPYTAEHPGIDFMNVVPATEVELDKGNLYFGAYENGTPENPRRTTVCLLCVKFKGVMVILSRNW